MNAISPALDNNRRSPVSQQWILGLSLATALSLLLTFIAAPQPTLASSGPTVNGLFYGDYDYLAYGAPFAMSAIGGAKLYKVIDGDTLYVALVVDGRYNDNVIDATASPYLASAAWYKSRNAVDLTNSEYAAFEVQMCGTTYNWQQGYARPSDNKNPRFADNTSTVWVSNAEINTGAGTPPPGYSSSSSLVWNLNNWREQNSAQHPTYNMNANCGATLVNGSYESGCSAEQWKSPFDLANPNSVIVQDGSYPPTFVDGDPITYSTTYQWEWAMVYEWSADVSGCTEAQLSEITIRSDEAHHSPYKTIAPTAVTLSSVGADSGATMSVVSVALTVCLGTVVTGTLRKLRRA